MDISNAIANVISPCFFYDGYPGSSLCSYCQGNEGPSILFFQFRTVDRDSILANANAIISSLYISDVVVFPVGFQKSSTPSVPSLSLHWVLDVPHSMDCKLRQS